MMDGIEGLMEDRASSSPRPPTSRARTPRRRIMWSVVGGLVPVVLASVWYFGPSAILVMAAADAGVRAHRAGLRGRGVLWRRLRGHHRDPPGPHAAGRDSPVDGVPGRRSSPSASGKMIFGGLGQNVFNPALLGRAFMQAAFPQALTTWPKVGLSWWALRGDNLALPFMTPHVVSTITGATPLGLMKFESQHTELAKLIFGSTGGSLGETASLVILLCGGYLALKKYLEWRIPVSIFVTVAVLSQLIHVFMPGKPDALFMLFSGGLMLGAVFMATDMVTSPTTPKGAWIYGVGIGVLVVVIRLWGGLPEGVMYSISSDELPRAVHQPGHPATALRAFPGEEGEGGRGMSEIKPPPKDDELFTPQGGGGGTGASPLGPAPEESKGVKLPLIAAEGPQEVPGDRVVQGAVGPGESQEKKEASAVRLLMTLGVAGALAGSILVFVFLWSQPKILAHRALVLREAVQEVLKGPDHFESVFIHEGALTTEVPEGVDTLKLDKVYLGYDQAGNPVGFAVEAEGFGFQDIISLIFGYDPATQRVLGMKVLENKETPGLGDKIVKDSAFVAGFSGAEAPILGVKPDRNTGQPDQVDMITGATISSKAVIRIINDRVMQLRELLAAYQPSGGGNEEGT